MTVPDPFERRGEGERRDPDALLARIAGDSPDLIAALDREFRFVAFNRAFRDHFVRVFDREIGPGARLDDILSDMPSELEKARRAWGRALDGEEYSYTAPIGDPETDPRRYEIAFRKLTDVEGRQIGAYHLARDVTEREAMVAEIRRLNDELEGRVRDRTAELKVANMELEKEIGERSTAERALRQSERSFRFLADTIPHLVWTTLPDGSHDYFNRRWYEYTGADIGETEGFGWLDVLHPDDRERAEARWQLSVDTGEDYSIEYRFRRHDGAYRWFLGLALPLRDDEGNIVRWFGTCTDIHDNKEAAEERERLYEQMRRASMAKSDFMATMSHELRTPLNAMIGYAELLELGVPEPIPAASLSHVERIRLSAAHLLQLIEEILTFTRLDAGQETVRWSPVDLGELTREVCAIIEPLVEKAGVGFGVDVPGEALEIRTDPRKLRQILLNLLGNAVKFTEEGRVELRAVADEDTVRFTVRDTGSGIPEAHLVDLFKPFWQADVRLTRETGGAGLGLAITQRFTRLLGGDVTVRSTVGEGSEFTVVLPRDPGLREEGWSGAGASGRGRQSSAASPRVEAP